MFVHLLHHRVPFPVQTIHILTPVVPYCTTHKYSKELLFRSTNYSESVSIDPTAMFELSQYLSAQYSTLHLLVLSPNLPCCGTLICRTTACMYCTERNVALHMLILYACSLTKHTASHFLTLSNTYRLRKRYIITCDFLSGEGLEDVAGWCMRV